MAPRVADLQLRHSSSVDARSLIVQRAVGVDMSFSLPRFLMNVFQFPVLLVRNLPRWKSFQVAHHRDVTHNAHEPEWKKNFLQIRK